MKDPVTINFASADDLPQLVELLEELFTLESDFRPDRDQQLRGLRLLLENPHTGRLFVLRIGGKVAGMANALITISTAEGGRVIMLEDVMLRGEYRGFGHGRLLVEHVLDWAAEQGMLRVTLLADRDNLKAQSFYRRLGFELSNMIVMRKKNP